jgi:uncharacterized protein (DUF1778 family)
MASTPDKSAVVSARIPAAIKERLDSAVERSGHTRNTFVYSAIVHFLKDGGYIPGDFDSPDLIEWRAK